MLLSCHYRAILMFLSFHYYIFIILYHIISYFIILYHIILHYTFLYYIKSHYIILFYIILNYIILYHIISYYIILYHIISYHIISYHISIKKRKSELLELYKKRCLIGGWSMISKYKCKLQLRIIFYNSEESIVRPVYLFLFFLSLSRYCLLMH